MKILDKKATKSVIRNFINDIHCNLLETLGDEGLSIVELDSKLNKEIGRSIKYNFEQFLELYDLSLSIK